MTMIDFHTHVFPDSLASRAINALESGLDSEYCARLDGRLSSLLASMDAAGIDKSVICPIATKPTQFDVILEWSLAIQSERIIPLGSIHPDAADVAGEVARIADAGLIGMKLHPMYQDFEVDEPRLDPLYAAAAAAGLIIVLHSGYDIAFDDNENSCPSRIASVIRRYPALKLVATHLGGWKAWDKVRTYLADTDIMIESSYSLDWMDPAEAVDLIRTLGVNRIMFGSDSPWTDQSEQIQRMAELGFTDEERTAIFGGNAERFLASL